MKENNKIIKKILIKDHIFLLMACLFLPAVILLFVEYFSNAENNDTLILLIMFTIADAGLWIVSIRIIIKNIIMIHTVKNGVEYKAIVTKIADFKCENMITRYSIHYEWVNEKERLCQGVSRPIYSEKEANAFLKNKNITIKVWKKNCIITTIPKIN